jgi:hypothetical protein
MKRGTFLGVRLAVLIAATLLGGSACSSSNASRGESPTPNRDPDIITADELAKTSGGSTVYDAVRQLRPNWEMRARPAAAVRLNQPTFIVYVDGSRYGGFDTLRLIKWKSVSFVRYYSPGAAEAEFGPGHLAGAIAVKTLPH